MMDGRVETLHPKVHGGILGRRGTDDAIYAEQMASKAAMTMVVVNLHHSPQTVANPNVTRRRHRKQYWWITAWYACRGKIHDHVSDGDQASGL